MDCFSQVGQQRELPHCTLYLASEANIHWLVSIRIFQFKHEEASLREAKLYAMLAHAPQEGHWPVLQLYKVMVEGSGL